MTPRVYMPGECPPVGVGQVREFCGEPHVVLIVEQRTRVCVAVDCDDEPEEYSATKVATWPLLAPWASPTETVRDAGDERADVVEWFDAAYDEALRDGDADTASGIEWVRNEIKDGAHVGAGGKAK